MTAVAEGRTRRTKVALAQLDQQIIDILTADHPQSARNIFYRLTDPRLPVPVEKTEADTMAF